MPDQSLLLYGANGYTGRLITEASAAHRLFPILAGRQKGAIDTLSARYSLEGRVFDLNNSRELEKSLEGVSVVIHAAGPYQFTARQMAEACIKTGTHYLDINGDIAVFEMLKGYDRQAREAGIMIMPGVGFDVVPTDCIALLLASMMPDAVDLKLAFSSEGGGLSHGTATTMAGKLGEGGAVRKNGKIIRRPIGEKGMWVDFGSQKKFVMSIPWGDVATAYHTTGIPDIETYTGISPAVYRLLKLQTLFNWALRRSLVRKFIKKQIDQRSPGPDEAMRLKSSMLVWGEVTNAAGEKATARLSGPDGYTLTAQTSLIIAGKVLSGMFTPGFQTPALVYGADLIMEVPGVKRELG